MSAMGRQLGRARPGESGRRLDVPAATLILVFLVAIPLGAMTVGAEAEAGQELDASILRVGLPLAMTGAAAAATQDGILRLDSLADADPGLLLRVDAAELLVRVHTVARGDSIVPEDRVGVLSRLPLGNQETADAATHGPFSSAWISLDGAAADAYLLAYTSSPGDAEIASESLTGAATLHDVPRETQLSYRSNPGTHDNARPVGPGTFWFEGESPASTMAGDFVLVMHGIDFSVGHANGRLDVQTGTGTSDSSSTGVGGVPLPGSEETTQFAVIELKAARMTLHSAAPQELYAPSGAMSIDVDGTMSSPGLAGGIRIGSDLVHAAGDPARLSGQFTFIPSGSGDSVAVIALQGEVETLTVGPQEYAATSDAIRTTAGIMVLAALGAIAWQVAKSGLALPLYAKLTRRKVLDQGTRNMVFLKIQQDPGVTTKAIAETLDVSWSTAAYHLRVLRHMGLITARRRGRHEHHFVAGERSLGDQEIMAALRHPTTRRIAKLVTHEPGIIQKDICSRLGIAPSTASDHLRRLKDLGAVREVQDWRTRSYHPVEGLQRVTAVGTETAVLHASPLAVPAAASAGHA